MPFKFGTFLHYIETTPPYEYRFPSTVKWLVVITIRSKARLGDEKEASATEITLTGKRGSEKKIRMRIARMTHERNKKKEAESTPH